MYNTHIYMHIYTCMHLYKKPYFCHSYYHIIYPLFSHNEMTKEMLVCYAKAAEEYIKIFQGTSWENRTF